MSLAMAAASATLVHCKCLEKTQIFSFSDAPSVGGAVPSANARTAPDIAAPSSNARRDNIFGAESLIMRGPRRSSGVSVYKNIWSIITIQIAWQWWGKNACFFKRPGGRVGWRFQRHRPFGGRALRARGGEGRGI